MRVDRSNGPLVYVRELEQSDVPRLVELEELCHPPEARDGIEFFDTLLGANWHEWPILYGKAQPGRRPIRLGLAVGAELVGYMIARGCEADGAAFVHIDDVAVLPGQRRQLVRLLSRFFRQRTLWYADEPMVAHAYESLTKLYEQHRRAAERAGLVVTGVEPVSEWAGTQPIYRTRWEPRASGRERGAAYMSARADAAKPDSIGAIRADGAEYDIAVATTVPQWESLRDEWNPLLERVPGSTAFQTFRFLRLWWDHLGVSGSLFIVVVRRAGELVGIAPLAVVPSVIGDRAYRQLGFIGSRWEIDRPRFLFAGDRGEPEACARAVARAIVARRDDWDYLYLYEQPAESTIDAALTKPLRDAGYLVGHLPDSICPYIRTEGDWAAFLDTRSRGLRKNLQRGRRRLERDGPVEYRVIDAASAIDAAFTRYLEVEARSWKADTEVGLRADPVHRSFYRDLTQSLGQDRRIEFRFIDVGGEPVAGTFGICHQRQFYSLKIAHDQRFAAASPGTLLESLEIRDCFEHDVVEYDFLGGFLTNKNRWTDESRTTVQVFAVPRRGRWIHFYIDRFVLRPRIKQLLRRAGWLEPMLAWRDRIVRRTRRKEPAAK